MASEASSTAVSAATTAGSPPHPTCACTMSPFFWWLRGRVSSVAAPVVTSKRCLSLSGLWFPAVGRAQKRGGGAAGDVQGPGLLRTRPGWPRLHETAWEVQPRGRLPRGPCLWPMLMAPPGYIHSASGTLFASQNSTCKRVAWMQLILKAAADAARARGGASERGYSAEAGPPR